jgi:AraC-like DNA-binding protein
MSVRELARRMGIGDRALRAWSATHLGMGIRRFMTIRRLHRALEQRIRHPDTTWSRIAAAAGFADQSHLVRDCRALLGESPSEFLARAR